MAGISDPEEPHHNEEFLRAMDRAKDEPTKENFHHLIKKLQEKLEVHGNNGHDHHDRQIIPGLGGRLPSLNNSTSLEDGHGENSNFNSGKSLNTDTIILVASLLAMILIGLIFHQVISYAAKLRSRRRQYESGLKQFGDQMNMVTRTISNPPSANPTPTGTPTGTPSIGLRKLAALNNNNQKMGQNLRMVTGIPDDDNSVFKPSTHVMRREDSALGTMTTATQLRHQELHIHHDDED